MTFHDPLIGAKLGNYRIIRPLGMGGMGKVYFAQDETLKRHAAVKVIHEQYRSREDYKTRLLTEASAIANLKHPNIVQIYTAGEQEDILFFAMEMIGGRNLKDLMKQAAAEGTPIDYEAVILIGNGVAAALDYAHENGVIHRDVKPGNVLITDENKPHIYLTDFGLALDVRDTLQMAENAMNEGGTAQYMSPEQIDPDLELGPKSDQYSLGILLYEMLTGAVPFDDPDPRTILNQHLNNPPPKPRSVNARLTPTVEDILLRVLAKRPEERFENCMAFMRRLTHALSAAKEASPSRIALPALPAGMRAKHGLPTEGRFSGKNGRGRKSARSQERTTPNQSVRSDEITRPREDAPAVPHPQRQHRDDRFLWLGLGIFSSILIILSVWVGLNFWRNRNLLSLLPLASPTGTPTPTSTELPTQTPRPTALPTLLPTATPTLPPPTAPPSPSPLPVNPTGDAFALIYDDTSFNLLNLSEQARNISVLRFERLDHSGNPLESFSGQQWARYNEIIRPNTCMRIKISNAPFQTKPEECHNTFDAEVTISSTSESDFWIISAGSSEFRVLWAGREIQRCGIFSGRCDILLP